jgi:AraC-like DNA-binding protein
MITDTVHIPAVDVVERVHDDKHALLWQVRGASGIGVRIPAAADGTPGRRLRTVTLTAGHALWIPAGIRHRLHVHAESTVLPTFHPVHIVDAHPTSVVTVPVGEALQTLILVKLQQRATVIRPRVNISRRIAAFIADAPAVTDSLPTPLNEPARQVAEAIRSDPGDDRTLAELAASVHTSLRTIQRSFTAETGMSLNRWRSLARLGAGAELLCSGRGLAAVANRVGYANESSFCRAFKTYFGITTSEYRRRYGHR